MMIDNDSLVKGSLLKGIIKNWQGFLDLALSDAEVRLLQLHKRTGRPLGEESFIRKLERKLNRFLIVKPAGRHKKKKK